MNKKMTPKTAKILASIRKSVRNRQSELAWALLNPVLINPIEDVNSLVKKFYMELPTNATPERPPSLKSLISKMRFHEKSQENNACI